MTSHAPSHLSDSSATNGLCLSLPRGLPGFVDLRALDFATIDDEGTFAWLTGPAGSRISFLAVDPFVYFPDYVVDADDETLDALGVDRATSRIAVYAFVTIDRARGTGTVNLAAPLLVDFERSVCLELR